ncbi:MAG: BTAD domain-containing putative transcriptional regulator [Gammaproteobacteria bacterium]
MDPLLDRLDSLIKRFGPLDHMVELQLAPRVLAALLVRRPSDPSFEDWRKLAFDAFDDPYIDLGLRLVAGFYLMVSHVWAGDPTHARQIVEMLKNMAREADASPIARVTALMVEGWLAALSAQREESFDAMEAGLELAKESGVHLWDSMLMLIGATVAKIRGDKETAARILDELSTQLSQLRPLDRLYFYHQRAWLAMLQDDPVRAQADQRVALEFAVRVGSKYSLADANYGMMWVMHALKDKLERDRYFAEVERLEGELNSVYLEFMLCFARAAFALDEKNPSEIRMRVADLMRLGREYWLTGMTWWQPRIASRLCSVALGEGIEVDYALHLIRLHGLVPEDETQMSTTWPYPVRIKTLGMFSVMVDDQPLQSEGRGQRKPLELLAAVIALGAVNVGEEQVMDALWPEADITQARQNLKAALHRLRRMIGMRSVSVQAGKISLDSRYVWVDVQSFMRLIEEIEACMSDGSDVPGHLLREWMSLYQGEFLAGEPGIWALQLRENVRAKALRLLEQVGDMLLRQGDGSEARKYFERGIEIDPYAEVFYRGLMQSHHQLGRVVEVRKVYERCEQLLKEAFGVGCSPETEALYRSAGMIDEGRQS